MIKDATRISVPIVELNSLQRLRYASDCCFALAEREREKGDRADLMFVLAMMQVGALCAAKAAPYVHPKLAAMPVDITNTERSSIDLGKLTDEELAAFERIVAKAQVPIRDQSVEGSRSADEYLPTREIKEDGRKAVDEADDHEPD
ncbi:hypothetical protein ACVWZV_004547 [Bradyrhizobium sp. GM5.1]